MTHAPTIVWIERFRTAFLVVVVVDGVLDLLLLAPFARSTGVIRVHRRQRTRKDGPRLISANLAGLGLGRADQQPVTRSVFARINH